MTSSAARDLGRPAGAPSAATVEAGRSLATGRSRSASREGRRPPRGAPAASDLGSGNSVDSTPRPALLLDLDPELGGGIESQDWELARQAIRAELIRVDPGVWSLPTNPANSGNIIGLIVNDGMISRETALSQHVAFELLTPGDVLLLAPPGRRSGSPRWSRHRDRS